MLETYLNLFAFNGQKGLKDWPQQHANALEKKGFPAKAILNATLDAAEKVGYKWPVRYVVK